MHKQHLSCFFDLRTGWLSLNWIWSRVQTVEVSGDKESVRCSFTSVDLLFVHYWYLRHSWLSDLWETLQEQLGFRMSLERCYRWRSKGHKTWMAWIVSWSLGTDHQLRSKLICFFFVFVFDPLYDIIDPQNLVSIREIASKDCRFQRTVWFESRLDFIPPNELTILIFRRVRKIRETKDPGDYVHIPVVDGCTMGIPASQPEIACKELWITKGVSHSWDTSSSWGEG